MKLSPEQEETCLEFERKYRAKQAEIDQHFRCYMVWTYIALVVVTSLGALTYCDNQPVDQPATKEVAE